MDSPKIEDLFIEMMKEIYKTYTIKGYDDGYLSRFFEGGEDCIFVMKYDGDVIEYISVVINREGEEYAYVDDFSVDSHHRKSGYGTRLISEAEFYAKQLGIPIILCTLKSKTRVQKGFTRRSVIHFSGRRVQNFS